MPSSANWNQKYSRGKSQSKIQARNHREQNYTYDQNDEEETRSASRMQTREPLSVRNIHRDACFMRVDCFVLRAVIHEHSSHFTPHRHSHEVKCEKSKAHRRFNNVEKHSSQIEQSS